jgi:hypothetical protein
MTGADSLSLMKERARQMLFNPDSVILGSPQPTSTALQAPPRINVKLV